MKTESTVKWKCNACGKLYQTEAEAAGCLCPMHSHARTPVCGECGRRMRPAPARFEGVETFCGYMPCKCSWTVYLEHHDPGESLAEYRARINEITCGRHGYSDECDCEGGNWTPAGFIGP